MCEVKKGYMYLLMCHLLLEKCLFVRAFIKLNNHKSFYSAFNSFFLNEFV